MGPLVYTSGSVDGPFKGARGVLASMGPLVYTSGSFGCLSTVRSCSPRFNGAAGLHQRKPAVVLPMVRVRSPASMGPLVYTSGSEHVEAMAKVGGLSFNGAAGLHQRKLRRKPRNTG